MVNIAIHICIAAIMLLSGAMSALAFYQESGGFVGSDYLGPVAALVLSLTCLFAVVKYLVKIQDARYKDLKDEIEYWRSKANEDK